MYQTIICVASIFFIDQLTKYLVLAYFLDHPQTIELTSFLNIILVWNKGIGFGLLPAGNFTHVILLILLGLILSALLVYFMIKAQTKWQLLSFAMILGGGIGNIV
ncbi:MAG: signal peptidase II, partial [Proteobacteria bacterium]|nr:signal peptidase II [Pseudomonadota bacterium]